MNLEKNIVYETPSGYAYVYRDTQTRRIEVRKAYGATASIVDCAFENTPDGESLARARADYLDRQHCAKGRRHA